MGTTVTCDDIERPRFWLNTVLRRRGAASKLVLELVGLQFTRVHKSGVDTLRSSNR